MDLEQALGTYGEIMVVLDSGAEYELHKHDTELNRGTVETVGMLDGEYSHIVFSESDVEHYYYHKVS